MEGKASRQDELTGIGKKRKLQDEQLEMPVSKQVCLDCWDTNTEPRKIENDEFDQVESDPESTNSNSFNTSSDSFMSDPDCPETRTSDEPSTSSASWATTLYSSSINSSSTEPESSSSKVSEYGTNLDFAMYGGIKNCTDEELDDLLKEVAPNSGFILSSGRWSVKQDAQHEGKKKLTIDKEFEQYFSMLML